MSFKPNITKLKLHPSFQEITSLLQQCKHKHQLNQIHAHMITTDLVRNLPIASKLVASFASIPLPAATSTARLIAGRVDGLDTYTWNAVIRGYLAGNQPEQALLVYVHVRSKGMEVDSYTLQFAIKACRLMATVAEGKQLHNHILKLGFVSQVIIQTALLNLYASFGELDCMHQVFDEMPQRDLIMWNSIVSAYSQHNLPYKALAIASAMGGDGFRLNGSSVVSLLSVCSSLKASRKGKEVHGYVIRGHLIDNHDVFVYNALINMYSKCGSLSSARWIFQMMPVRNVVSWTSMISGYSDNNHLKEALALFEEMVAEDIRPDEVTILGVISMSSKLQSLKLGEWIDHYLERIGFPSTESIAMSNALMDMHAKCGNIKKACEIFDGMPEKSLVSWTTMIHGLTMHGLGREALAHFSEMLKQGFKPDGIFFLNILSACSHAGLVNEGPKCFESMVNDYHMKPWMEHYGCMVDLLCRAGLLTEAFEFVLSMPDKPDRTIWRMLLQACQGQGDSLASRIMNHLHDIGPENIGDYGLLSNLYAAMAEWDKVKEIRNDMKAKGVIKQDPGSSSIEVRC